MKFKYLGGFFTLLLVIFVATGDFFVLKDDENFDPKIYSLDSDESVQSYIINLDKSKDRLDYILPQVKELGYSFERISAVYGKNIPEDERKKLADYDKFKSYMKAPIDPGTIGCYMSHAGIWKKFLESNHKYALIFEDDVKFDPKELRKVVDGVIKSKTSWDIVSFESLHRGMPSAIEKIAEPNSVLSKYRARISHTGCYIINRSAAIKLLAKAFPILMPVDHFFIRSWEIGTIFRGVEPRVVHQKFGDSEIANQNQSKEKNICIVDELKSFIFQTKTSLAVLVHSFFE